MKKKSLQENLLGNLNKKIQMSLPNDKLYALAEEMIDSNKSKEEQLEGIALFERIADRGYVVAQMKLADLFRNGKMVDLDKEKALYWYERAAEQGNVSGQYNAAEYYRNGKVGEKNLDKAFALYKKAAEQGHDKAQNMLGRCYDEGWGVELDYKKALEWYEKSAEQGNKSAQWNAALLYENGKVGEKNLEKAFALFKEAAEQGDDEAQNRLGQCYSHGWGVETDKKKALEWYERAAEQGNVSGQYNAAEYYRNGKAGEKNLDKAFALYKKAAEQGHDKAQNMLGRCYDEGWGVELDYKKALEWYEKAAKQGNANGQHNAAYLYRNGEAEIQDVPKAVELFVKAAEQGHARAQYEIATFCKYRKNYAEAFTWCRKAALQGEMEAQNLLGVLFEQGIGTKADYKEALKWYEKAAEQGYAKAQYNMARLYQNGKAGEKNPDKAFELFEKIAKQGHVNAQNAMGICYSRGLGAEVDYVKALEWYEKAVKQGNGCAQYLAAQLYRTGEAGEKDLEKAFSLLEKAINSEDCKNIPDFLSSSLKAIYVLGEEFESLNNENMRERAIECYQILHNSSEEEFKMLGLERLVHLGKLRANYSLADAYRVGKYLSEDGEKAISCLVEASKVKSVYAQFVKACLCMGEFDFCLSSPVLQDWISLNDDLKQKGKGVPFNEREAFVLFNYLAEEGLVDALFCLAFCYHNGIGVVQDIEKAQSYLKQFKLNYNSSKMLNQLDVSLYETQFKLPVLKQYLEDYYADVTNWYLQEKNKNYSPKNLKIPDLSTFFETKEQAYQYAVEFDFGREKNQKYAIMLYSYAASIGSKKALYSLINMAMEETEYFIDVISLVDGGEM